MKKITILVGIILVFILGLLFLNGRKSIQVSPTPDKVNKIVDLKDGRQCYTYNHEANATEPYTVNEFIDIVINGANVTGTKRGTQSGPDMTNGYTGTMTGTLEKNTITSVFSYVVEESHNQEKEIYRASETGIEKLRYPLTEGKGILVPDTTKEPQILLYARVGCTASN